MGNFVKEDATRKAYALREDARTVREYRELMLSRTDLTDEDKGAISLDMRVSEAAREKKAALTMLSGYMKWFVQWVGNQAGSDKP